MTTSLIKMEKMSVHLPSLTKKRTSYSYLQVAQLFGLHPKLYWYQEADTCIDISCEEES